MVIVLPNRDCLVYRWLYCRSYTMKKNKWVKENNKWLEYKCIKFVSKNKKYMSILHKAVKLHPVDIHYLVNTLEDILDSRGYERYES